MIARPEHPLIQTPPADLNDVMHGPLLHIGMQQGSSRGAFAWARWGEAMGLGVEPSTAGTHLTAEHLAVDYLHRKDVLGLVSIINAAGHLERGSLAILPGTQVLSDCSYWIMVHPGPAKQDAIIQRFAAWLNAHFAKHR